MNLLSITKCEEVPRLKTMIEADEYYFPDEILINILSRLPAKAVLNFRSVCSRWRDLTSDQNQHFLDLHLKFGIPMILAVDQRNRRRKEEFLFDGWWETKRRGSVIYRFGSESHNLLSEIGVIASHFAAEYCIDFSMNGLIVSKQFATSNVCSRKFVIFNPMNCENLRIQLSKEIHRCDLYGVYFHPLLRQYCTLWRIWPNERSMIEEVEYRVLNLGSKPCWKKIRNPSSKNTQFLNIIAPVFINEYLYWAVAVVVVSGEDSTQHILHIMEFDIINEELKMLPCPVPAGFNCFQHNISIVNVENRLSLVHIVRRGDSLDEIKIWMLKEQVWECSEYIINHQEYPRSYQFMDVGSLRAICAANGELAMKSGSTLLVYNLNSGTIKIMGRKKHKEEVVFLSHLMSFASLKDCKPNIYVDEKGEVNSSSDYQWN